MSTIKAETLGGLMQLSNQVIMINGAAGAIGTEVCLVLAAEGARLVLTDIHQSSIDELTDRITNLGGSAIGFAMDASEFEQVQGVLAQARETVDQVDGLVNVAGYFSVIDFLQSDQSHWEQMLSANLLTAMATCRAVLPNMVEKKRGAIVNFTSTAGEFGSIRPSAAYAAAKGGVIAFTKSLAREVSPSQIRVNCISPGPVDTPGLQAASEEDRAIAASRTLLGRLGTVHDIARSVLYLLSDDASFVTGEVLRVNGGSLL